MVFWTRPSACEFHHEAVPSTRRDAAHLRLLASELETRRAGLALALLLLGSRRNPALTLALGSVDASLLGLACAALGFRRDGVGSLAFDLGAGRFLALLRQPAAGLLPDASDIAPSNRTSLGTGRWLELTLADLFFLGLLSVAAGSACAGAASPFSAARAAFSAALAALASLRFSSAALRRSATSSLDLASSRRILRPSNSVHIDQHEPVASAQQRCGSSEPDPPWSFSCSTAFLASASSLYDAKAYPAGRLPKRRGRATDRLTKSVSRHKPGTEDNVE